LEYKALALSDSTKLKLCTPTRQDNFDNVGGSEKNRNHIIEAIVSNYEVSLYEPDEKKSKNN